MKRMLLWILFSFILVVSLVWFMAFPPIPANLVGSRWALQSIQSANGSIRWSWDDPERFFFKFSRSGRVTGEADCNRFDGWMHVIRFTHKVWVQPMFSSMVYCLPMAPLFQDSAIKEAEFLQGLHTATRYELQDDELRIYSGHSAQVLVFREVIQ